MPLARHYTTCHSYSTSIVFIEIVKCPLLHSHLVDCANTLQHLCIYMCTLERTYEEKWMKMVMMSQFWSTLCAAVAFSPCFHGALILFYIHISHARLTCCWTGDISYWVTGFFVLFFGVDWSIIWQQRTWSKWFLLKVLMIYSALLQARGQSRDEYDLSALWTGGLIL